MTEEFTSLLPQQSQQNAADDTVLEMEDAGKSQPGVPLLQTPCVNKPCESFKPSFPNDENGNDKDALKSVVIDAGSKPTDSLQSKRQDASSSSSSERDSFEEVHFHVGQGKQLMIAKACDVAAISPVFRVALGDQWRVKRKEGLIADMDIPDVETREFAVILRCASEGGATDDLRVTDDNVWQVLKAADMYGVGPVAALCFRHLLRKHKCRERSRHVCMVLELAHALNYPDQRAECLRRARQKARQIFRSPSGLRELCRDCLLRIIKDDKLHGVRNETLVYYAVVTWARCRYAEKQQQKQQQQQRKQQELGIPPTSGRGNEAPAQAPVPAAASWPELREVAGELVQHVRFLAMPQVVFKNLGNIGGVPSATSFFSPSSPSLDSSSCLLADEEIEQLLARRAPKGFTDRADKRIDSEHEENVRRLKKAVMREGGEGGCFFPRCFDSSSDMVSCVFLVGLVLLFLFAVLYVPIVLALRSDDPDAV